MELFQELLFTISFSLLVSLLVAKLFSMMSDYDDSESNPLLTSSKTSFVLDEKSDKEWVVCDSVTEENVGYFEDAVKVNDHEEKEEDNEGVTRVDQIGEKPVFDQVKVDRSEEKDLVSCSVAGRMDNVEPEKKKQTIVGVDEVTEQPVGVSEFAVQPFDESPERINIHKTEVEVGIVESKIAVQPFDESSERINIHQAEVGLVESNEGLVGKIEGIVGDEQIRDVKIEEQDKEKEEGYFDDWEGIERTELEKSFGAAVAFVGSKSNANRISLLDNEEKMKLYGLHKLATEGPCRESQPMALKISARANWNAWKRVGNASPEDAMQQYITLLSEKIPDWMGNCTSEDLKLYSYLEMQPGAEKETERSMNPLKPDAEDSVIKEMKDLNIINRDKQ